MSFGQLGVGFGSSFGLPSSGGDLLGIPGLGDFTRLGLGELARRAGFGEERTSSLPAPQFPTPISTPVQFPRADIPGMDLACPQGAGSLFKSGAAAPRKARPSTLVLVENPTDGSPTFFRHMGMPILFSGDLAACRRVERIAKRADKALHRRRPR